MKRTGLADVVVIPARDAVSKHGFRARVVVLARNNIAAGRAVKRIAAMVRLQ